MRNDFDFQPQLPLKAVVSKRSNVSKIQNIHQEERYVLTQAVLPYFPNFHRGVKKCEICSNVRRYVSKASYVCEI